MAVPSFAQHELLTLVQGVLGDAGTPEAAEAAAARLRINTEADAARYITRKMRRVLRTAGASD